MNLSAADKKLYDHLFTIEQEIVQCAKDLRILGTIGWPRTALDSFLESWRAGNPRIPQVELAQPAGLDTLVERMASCMQRTPRDHPLGDVIWKTAWSYSTAAYMLKSMGTEEFTERSIELYGRPDRRWENQKFTDLSAAEFMLRTSSDLMQSCAVPPAESHISAELLAEKLRERVDPLFIDDPIEVEVTTELASKAAASSKRVRLRADARFSDLDLDQLFEHEVMVHSATMLNGLHQPHLDVLGLGSPRTTRVQEGLATMAELATNSMDLARLRRIALRVRAVSLALAGADFIDIFRMFLEEGQSEEESAQSAMRIFRGGDPEGGGICFTKDGVYVGGLLEVHTFMRTAVRDGRPELIPLMFSGRVTLADVVVLAPLAAEGLVEGPRYIPKWAADLRRLTAYLTYSAFMTRIDLGKVELEHALEMEEDAIEESRALADGEALSK
ncbi:MAG: flavohemoglobin expression-modulating QEGLA motif protein [Halieaceae bacterium]|jgi:uncharacterized protein (TIGR02421 family)|nr:flavohemoglobin expression-modulating QEGLA motif protein [Halieaceae bacterium]